MESKSTSCVGSVNCCTEDAPLILLVEDEPLVRKIAGEVLSDAGYRVLESSDAAEALRIAGEHERIDLLLTDVVMPGISGVELARRLLSRQPDLITVLMSGYAEPDLRNIARLTTALRIQKPFTISALLARVREALNAREQRIEA